MNRISRCSFGRKVEMLKYEEKKSISGLLLNHFNEENRELCNRFLRNFVKS